MPPMGADTQWGAPTAMAGMLPVCSTAPPSCLNYLSTPFCPRGAEPLFWHFFYLPAAAGDEGGTPPAAAAAGGSPFAWGTTLPPSWFFG